MRPLTLLAFFSLAHSAAAAEPVSLFDGRTLNGWEGEKTKVWRVQDGAIVGGSLEGNPQNEFLTSKKVYRNFILQLEYKLEGTEGFVNGGVQFRSVRIPQPPNEMSGYQADIGQHYWGALYDESRRKKVLAAPAKEVLDKIVKHEEWNDYRIRCQGPRIQLWLNGTLTVDYTEKDEKSARTGIIGLQVHGGAKAKVHYKDIRIEELPAKAE